MKGELIQAEVGRVVRCLITDCKLRGEWAELCFMTRAAGLGLGVLRPHGDSLRYDVAVESGRRIVRVQVKSTIYCRRGGEYCLNVLGPRRKRYAKGTVDYFAVYLIPIDTWYIFPFAAVGKKQSLQFSPAAKKQKHGKYKEAWHLLWGAKDWASVGKLGVVEIQACADESVAIVLTERE